MRHPSPLPEGLRHGAFSIGDAAAFGVTAGRLDARDLIIPFPGVRDHAGGDGDQRTRCHQFSQRMKPWQFFSHDTALEIYGAPMPMRHDRTAIHVAAHRPEQAPRIRGVVGHRLSERLSDTRLIAGLRLEHPARAWRQVGATWRLDDLVAAGDYLIGRGGLTSIAELEAEVAAMPGRGSTRLAQALVAIRPGSESSEETRLRLLLVRAGLPEPELNWVLHDRHGTFVARLDTAYLRWRVAPEYDGRQHAEDPAQFERDADRWDAIRREGWDHVRILRHHMRGTGELAVRKVRDALLRAGWRP